MSVQADEVAMLGKCFLYMHEDLSLDALHPCKRQTIAHVYNLSVRGGRPAIG